MATNITPEEIAGMYEVVCFGECGCGRVEQLYRRGKLCYCMWCLVESIKRDFNEFEHRTEEEEKKERRRQFTLLEAMGG